MKLSSLKSARPGVLLRPGALAPLALLASAGAALAGGWQLQYLAESGGSHPVVVGRAEAEFAEAYLRDAVGNGLYLSCWTDEGGNRTIRYSAAGEAAFGGTITARIGLSDGDSIDLNEMPYAGGSYFTALGPESVERLQNSAGVILAVMGEEVGTEFDFPAGGLREALADPVCAGQ
ncbi:hypothetical protein HOY34_11440 [Xinfangfangia sp. D13-10-4-6]|uniref:hypothetical protein n=1 Tax=Pseudogemmobacter hezensis TaxID=2737662 RepID=UPI001557EAFB|nr:hypothetical protein [Pseudogemmobacter hezensis]NPD15815.1 hypothetical protein [Pseudogemmobacter hezensis]